MKRILPPLSLAILSPVIAEYLLGDIEVVNVVALLPMALLYGTGAILVREGVRRGGDWRRFVLLALAYALWEEGLLTQSLFNPGFLGLRLLDYGYLPRFGTALPWVLYVIPLHVAWSIAVPIGLAEVLFAGRRREPWLGRIGLAVTMTLFLAGSALNAWIAQAGPGIHASWTQTVVCAALVLGMVVAAFVLRPASSAAGKPAAPRTTLFVAFILGSAFLAAYGLGQRFLSWPVMVAVQTVLGGCALWFFGRRAQGGLNAADAFTATAGGLLVYVWYGFIIDGNLHGSGNLVGRSVLIAVMLGLTVWAGCRVRAQEKR